MSLNKVLHGAVGIGLVAIMVSPFWFIPLAGKQPYATLAFLGLLFLITASLAVLRRRLYNKAG